jgi:phosphatidylglycerophosphate synthase
VARIKQQVTRLGAFLDPLADKLLMLCACVILAGQTTSIENYRLPITVVVLIIGKDVFLALGFLTVYMMVSPEVHLKPVISGKAATFLQLSMVLAILVAPEMEKLLPVWWYFARVLWWTATAVAVITVIVYIRTGAMFVQQHE